jgi:signal transduction histidine kinase
MPICEFLQDVIVEKQLELEESGVNVSYTIDIAKDKLLAIDGKMVYRIMSNIMSNAIKYGNKETPEIHIEASEESDGVKVAISDNGQGISQENLEHIFDVFFREDVSRNKEIGGTGLGLSIAKQLVQAHGGAIFATSKMGEGTTITFTLKDQNLQEDHDE